MGEGPGAIGGGEARGVRPGRRQGRADLGEALGDEADLELGLVGDVLVQRGRPDADALGDPPHAHRLASLGLEQDARGLDGLGGAVDRLAHARWLPSAARSP